jgi:exosortase
MKQESQPVQGLSAPQATSLSAMVDGADLAPAPSLSQSAIIKLALLGGLFILMHFRQFPVLWDTWWHNPNWNHGIVIPLFSLYLLYSRRNEILSAPCKRSYFGLALFLLFTVAGVVAYYPMLNTWGTNICMVLTLFGLVLYLCGWRIIALTWLPILFLLFALPISDNIYVKVAGPLQALAAKYSAIILNLLGARIEVAQSRLTIHSLGGFIHPLEVAEACSGVRSLLAFVALGVAWAYLENRPVWQRAILVAATVPVAVACNILRVTITATMFVIDKPELGTDFMHEFTGLLMLIPAFLIFWGLSGLLKRIFVEVEDEEEPSEPAATGEPKP